MSSFFNMLLAGLGRDNAAGRNAISSMASKSVSARHAEATYFQTTPSPKTSFRKDFDVERQCSTSRPSAPNMKQIRPVRTANQAKDMGMLLFASFRKAPVSGLLRLLAGLQQQHQSPKGGGGNNIAATGLASPSAQL